MPLFGSNADFLPGKAPLIGSGGCHRLFKGIGDPGGIDITDPLFPDDIIGGGAEYGFGGRVEDHDFQPVVGGHDTIIGTADQFGLEAGPLLDILFQQSVFDGHTDAVGDQFQGAQFIGTEVVGLAAGHANHAKGVFVPIDNGNIGHRSDALLAQPVHLLPVAAGHLLDHGHLTVCGGLRHPALHACDPVEKTEVVGESVAVPEMKPVVGFENKDADARQHIDIGHLLDGGLDASFQAQRTAQRGVNGAIGRKLQGVLFALLFGPALFGFVPDRFDGPHNLALGSFYGSGGKPAPFAAVAQVREKGVGFVGAFNKGRTPPFGTVQLFDLGFLDLVHDDVGHGGALLIVKRGPRFGGTDDLPGVTAAESLQCPVPMGYLVVFADHEGGNRAAVDDLGCGLLAGTHLFHQPGQFPSLLFALLFYFPALSPVPEGFNHTDNITLR